MTGIQTTFVYPPIPMRNSDWCATFDGYEPGDLTGWGATEEAAIQDLLEMADNRPEVVRHAMEALQS